MNHLNDTTLRPGPNVTIIDWSINAPGWSALMNRFFRTFDDLGPETRLTVHSADIKYGSLRLGATLSSHATDAENAALDKATFLAEARSMTICPRCGSPAKFYEHPISPDVACEIHSPKNSNPVEVSPAYTARDGVRYRYDRDLDDAVSID